MGKAIGHGRTNPRSRMKVSTDRGFTPTCTARNAIRATQRTGTVGLASQFAGSRLMGVAQQRHSVGRTTCALLNDGHYIVYAVREGAKQSLNVRHSTKEYARGDVHVNTAESSHALIRRGLIGIYHNVSREYLHRYLWQFDFLGTIGR